MSFASVGLGLFMLGFSVVGMFSMVILAAIALRLHAYAPTYFLRTQATVSMAMCVLSSLWMPCFWSALLGLIGVDKLALVVAFSFVWGLIWIAVAVIAVVAAAAACNPPPSSEEPQPNTENAPVPFLKSPPIIDAPCFLCQTNPALGATLFKCGHAFVCSECFPETIRQNLQKCPYCRVPRL